MKRKLKLLILLIIPFNLFALPESPKEEKLLFSDFSQLEVLENIPGRETDSFTYFKGNCYTVIGAGVGIGHRHRVNQGAWDFSLNYAGTPYDMRTGLVTLKASHLSYNTPESTSFYKGLGLEGGILFFPIFSSPAWVPFPNIELIFGKEFYSPKTNKKKFIQVEVNLLPFVMGTFIDKGNPILEPLIVGIACTSISAGISF